MSSPAPRDPWQRVTPSSSALPSSVTRYGPLYPVGVTPGPAHQEPVVAPVQTVHVYHHQPVAAAHAHSLTYWLLLGFWWAPTKWLGRVILWLTFWPLGLWRSHRAAQRKTELKVRRGQR